MMTRRYFGAFTQILGACFFLVLLAVMPSARGTMLLLPVGSHAGAGLAAKAIAAGGVPVGLSAGGALLVQGERARLMPAMLFHAVIPIAAQARFCGARQGDDV